MITQVLHTDSSADCQQVVSLLRSGELVAIPTETVYGLAADAAQPAAVQKIFAAKERPRTHPLIVHIHSVDMLTRWAVNIPPAAYALAEAFWPGPLTILLPKAPQVNDTVTGGLDTIALRIPDHPVLLQIIEALNSGVAAPSANPHKRLSPTSAAQVLAGLNGKIAAVLDGGPCKVGLESTIVDLTSDQVRILRSGPITREHLEQVLQQPVSLPDHHVTPVPGNMLEHYQPHAPLRLSDRDTLMHYLSRDLSRAPHEAIAVLFYKDVPAQCANLPNVNCQAMPQDKAEFACQLYQRLFELDQKGPRWILMERPPQDENWLDVNDRLSKAGRPLHPDFSKA